MLDFDNDIFTTPKSLNEMVLKMKLTKSLYRLVSKISDKLKKNNLSTNPKRENREQRPRARSESSLCIFIIRRDSNGVVSTY